MKIRIVARCAIAALIAALLTGCMANGYTDFYKPNLSVSAADIAARRLAPAPLEPELVHGTDPQNDIPAALGEGYLVVGTSSFNGPQASDANAIAQAKIVGADRVLAFGRYARTAQSVVPITTPTTQTSLTTGSATVFGSGGTATAFGSATTTSYGTQTTYLPISVDRYDYLAVYLVKARFTFGAVFRDLTNDEAKTVGSVNGVMIVSVVHGSPAADAGLLPGDAIVDADGKPAVDTKQLGEWLTSRQGKSISVIVVREGKRLSKTIQLAAL